MFVKNKATKATSIIPTSSRPTNILTYQKKVGCLVPPVICFWATSEEQLEVNHLPRDCSTHISLQIPTTVSWFEPSTFHLQVNLVISKFLPSFEPQENIFIGGLT